MVIRPTLDLIVNAKDQKELVVGILLLRQAWDLCLILGLLDQIQRPSCDRENLTKSILHMLELWLIGLKESVGGIVDDEARKRSTERWTEVSEAWSDIKRDAESDPMLKNLFAPLAERWPR